MHKHNTEVLQWVKNNNSEQICCKWDNKKKTNAHDPRWCRWRVRDDQWTKSDKQDRGVKCQETSFISWVSFETNLCHVKISDYKYENEVWTRVMSANCVMNLKWNCLWDIINLWHNHSHHLPKKASHT